MNAPKANRPAPLHGNWLWVPSIALLGLAASYLARGAHFLLKVPMPSDISYRNKWMMELWQRRLPWQPDVAPDPPWALPGNLLFFGLPAPACQWLYLTLFAGCLAAIACWAAQFGRNVGSPVRVLLAASTLAVSATCTTLGLGQNAVFVVALLVATLWLDDRERHWQAGLCMGIALGKPQIAGLFVLPLLFRRRYLTIAVAALVNVAGVATLVVITGAGVGQLLRAWLAYMHTIGTWPGYGPLQWSVRLGLPQNAALALTAVTFATVAAAAAFALRHRSTLPLFALMAVAGRMWTYHQQYDNVMLVFLLVATGHRFASRPGWVSTLWFASCGVTLWAPARACDSTAFQVFQIVSWIALAAYVAFPLRSGSTEPAGGLHAPAVGT